MDKSAIKEALSKDNVIKQIAEYPNGKKQDGLTRFNRNHIDQGEFSEEETIQIKDLLREKLAVYEDELKEYGYDLVP